MRTPCAVWIAVVTVVGCSGGRDGGGAADVATDQNLDSAADAEAGVADGEDGTPDRSRDEEVDQGQVADLDASDASGTLCTPGFKKCFGNMFTVCNDQGSGWLDPVACEGDETCKDGECVEPLCTPACEGKECGDNGCGGSCGTCEEGVPCADGLCCVPACEGKLCGPDGCGGECGECLPWLGCDQDGQCTNVCTQACEGKVCGPDGCGGFCGQCGPGLTCDSSGKCQANCTPSCLGKICGDNGCGSSCGSCPPDRYCQNGQCVTFDVCIPHCEGKECGDNGCGGDCGPCQWGKLCTVDEHCLSYCSTCQYDELCMAWDFELGNLVGWAAAGFCQVQTTLGATLPAQGKYMAVVTNAWETYGSIAFDGCVLSDQPVVTLSFQWKFYSEEFMEYCGAAFNDDFTVTLKAGPVPTPVFHVAVSDLCPVSPTCPACGGSYIGLDKSDVSFDLGDAYTTPWHQSEVNILGVLTPGETFYLEFKVQDQGDAKGNTYVLVDDVALHFCQPSCEGKECGTDGCGGGCGECPAGTKCGDDGKCECVPDCTGKECGDDGCGGSCGTCVEPESCQKGTCAICTPKCSGKKCGDDGCGGSCGTCEEGYLCSPQGLCILDCVPDCSGKECGSDGCGGDCGACNDAEQCTSDKCDPNLYACIFLPAAGPCDDGNPNTINDQCVNGKCKGE